MLSEYFLINFLYVSNTWLVVIFLLLIASLLRGKLSPKFIFLLLSITCLLGFILQDKQLPSNTVSSKQDLIKSDSSNSSSIVPEKEKEKIVSPSPTRPPKKKQKKFITKVQIEGIKSEVFFHKFTTNSGYTISKKGDYVLTFSHTGNIKRGKATDKSRYIYSGGNLIVNIGQDRCCCGDLIKIPKGIPLDGMKEGNQILAQKMEEYALRNIDLIIEMVSECLPEI